jgi:signal transduction histidine kinase
MILARADGGAAVTVAPVDLSAVVAAAARQAHRMSRGTRFELTNGTLGGVRVQASAEYLEQQLLILLDNAFKYTPPTGEVRLSASVDDGQARISVSDTGTGIPAEDLPRIFDRFHRGSNAGGVTGTGLGLAIAQWIADQHGGRLEVASSPGEGSTFTIVVPCRTDVAPATANPTGDRTVGTRANQAPL